MTRLIFLLTYLAIILGAIFVYTRIPQDTPEHPLNTLLDQQLQSFYSNEISSPISKWWHPVLETTGLTYSFDPAIDLRGEKFTDKGKAEERLAEVYSNFQQKLNSIPQIRPFLAEFPITPRSFSLSIHFKTPEGRHLISPYLSSVHMEPDEQLKFFIFAPEVKERYKQIATKPIADSDLFKPFFKPFAPKTILSSEDVKMPPLKLDKSDPSYWKSILTFTDSFSKRHHFFPLTLGRIGEAEGDQIVFGFALWSQEQLEFGSAHKIAAEGAKEFLSFLQHDKASLDFMKKRGAHLFDESATIPELRHIAFRISFWDAGINRQASPFIAEIRFQNSKFQYFTSDEGQNLIPLYQETFDQAMKFLDSGKPEGDGTQSLDAGTSRKQNFRIPQDFLTMWLEKQLENFRSKEPQAYPVRMWSPALERIGLTAVFEPFEILKGVSYSTVSDAEKKYAEIFSEYQNQLNSIPYIRPYLDEFPLTPNSIHLEVGLRDEQNEPWPADHFSSIILEPDGKMNFLALVPTGEGLYKPLFMKPLTEIQSLKPYFSPFVERSPLPQKEAEIVSLPYDLLGMPYKHTVISFMHTFAQQHHLLPLLTGCVDDRSFMKQIFTFAVCGRQKIPFEEAHLLAANCAQDFLDLLKKDKETLDEMKKRSNDPNNKDRATIPEPRHVAFRISFWDEAINRQASPYISEIQFSNSLFKYYTSDAGQRLVLVHEETYDDAVKFLKENK